ncbi:testis-expressed protein 26-like isoform X2 [Hoplias malabaricus]
MKWDPYETSHRREFVYRPNYSTPVLRPMTSKSFRNSYDLADPVGVTAYSEDFCWKPPSKSSCIRTGSASGNRRNNPHPSQAFMVWKIPPGRKLCENLPSEEEVRRVLSAQYKSTYRTDFLGLPQGVIMNRTHTPVKHSSYVPQSIETEMRFNYRKPILKAELQGNVSRYGCVPHRAASKGIVPTVIQKHINNHKSRNQLTTYDQHYGGKCTDPASVLKTLKPQELEHFWKTFPEKEKRMVQTFMQRTPSSSGQVKKAKNPAGASQAPPVLDRVSDWPGPL